MGDITDLLSRARDCDRGAMDEPVRALYPELHRMAHARLAQNSTITLLDTTSMVHETYLRLHNVGRIEAESRGQFGYDPSVVSPLGRVYYLTAQYKFL